MQLTNRTEVTDTMVGFYEEVTESAPSGPTPELEIVWDGMDCLSHLTTLSALVVASVSGLLWMGISLYFQ